MTQTSERPLTARQKALLRAVSAAGGTDVVPHRDGRTPWRIERDGPGWKSVTFYDLADAGYLNIVIGFMNTPHITMTDAGYAAIGSSREAETPVVEQQTAPELQPAQMRTLRMMAAYGVEVHSHDAGAPRKATLEVLARVGHVELAEEPDGTWWARVTQAGRDKVSPPPIERGVSLANFLITGPDGSATNAENGAEALGQLAAELDWYAPVVSHQGFGFVADKMRTAAQRMRGVDPDYARWPVSVRFQTAPGTFLDFIADRCRPQRGES